jgi:hypothetical protein
MLYKTYQNRVIFAVLAKLKDDFTFISTKNRPTSIGRVEKKIERNLQKY